MSSLMKKVRDLGLFAWNDLKIAVALADKSGNYKDFEAAMEKVHATEQRLKAVRAHVRAKMRKTRQAFQDACPHTNKVDTRVRHSFAENDGINGRRIVEIQTCSNCSKSFDLREKVQ